MNKSIWLEMATTTTKRRSKKQVQCNVRRLREAKFFRGHSGGLGVLGRFLFSLSHLLRFLLHSSPLPVFWDGRQFPHCLNSQTPPSPFPCSLFQAPSYNPVVCIPFLRPVHRNCLLFLGRAKTSCGDNYASKYRACTPLIHEVTQQQYDKKERQRERERETRGEHWDDGVAKASAVR